MTARTVLLLPIALCVAADAEPKPTPAPTVAAPTPTPAPTPLPTAVPTPVPTEAPPVPYKETVKSILKFPVPDTEVDKYSEAGVKSSLQKCLAKVFGLAATDPQPIVEDVCNAKDTQETPAGPRCKYLMMGVPTPAPTAVPTPSPTPVPTNPTPAPTPAKSSRRLADVTRETLVFEYEVEDLSPFLKDKVLAGINTLKDATSPERAQFVGEFVTSAEFAAAALTPITADDVSIPDDATVVVKVPESFGTAPKPKQFKDELLVDAKYYRKMPKSEGKTCKNHEDIYFKETVHDAAFYDLTLPSICGTDCTEYVPPAGGKDCVGFEIIMKDETEAHCLLHNGKCELSDADPQPPGTEATLRGQYELVEPSKITKEMLAAGAGALLLLVCFYYMCCRQRKSVVTGKRGVKKAEPVEEESVPLAMPYFVQQPVVQMQPVSSFGVLPQQPMYSSPGYGYQQMGMAGFR